MRIEIITFAKNKDRGIEAAEAEYLKRLRGEFEPKLVTLAPRGKHLETDQTRTAEAAALDQYLVKGALLAALDEGGDEFTSRQFAEYLQKQMNSGRGLISFAIAGPFGWGSTVKGRADLLLSLGRMTFPAHIARFLLIEQLYRAHCILKGHPYHK